MFKNSSVSLAILFFAWLFFRCALTLWFCNSEYQAYLLTFAILSALLDFYVVGKWSKWSQQLHELARTSGKNSSIATRVVNAGFLLSILVPLLCVSWVSIQSLSSTGNPAPFHGTVSIDQAVALPEGGCFAVPEANPFTRYLGAVEWQVDSGDGQFFYAAPLESKDWEPGGKVRIWAIVNEHELLDGTLTSPKYFLNIPKRSMHYATFRLAVSNAEENLNLQSASDAILVRLVDTPDEVGSNLRGTTTWVLIAFGLIAIPIALYPCCYGLAPSFREEPKGAEAKIEPSRPTTLPRAPTNRSIPLPATRRFWFVTNVVGFIPLTVLLVTTRSMFLAIALALVLPLLELWLLMRSFSHPETRKSVRLAVSWLMPVAMVFGLILVIVCISHHMEYAKYDPQAILTNFESAPLDDTIFQVAEDLKMRSELTGSYWAPNGQTKAWRMVPLLKEGWQKDVPIDLWVLSTDRHDSIRGEQPLKFTRVLRKQDDFRISQAIENAESQHAIKSADNFLILAPVADPDKLLGEGNGFAVLGFMLCLLSWGVSSVLWPRYLIAPNAVE